MRNKATDMLIGRDVAIKLIRGDLDPDLFVREARMAGRLNHPNIVTIYDAGRADERTAFLAMEYLEGDTLNAFVTQQRSTTVPERLKLLEQLCEGLAAAHAAEVVQRDVKPGNIIVLRDQAKLKILDFGIARASGASTLQTGAAGTVAYMAPEQLLGGDVDARTDIFAVAAVAYELFSGQRAFPYDFETRFARARMTEVPSLARTVPVIGATLDAIIHRGLMSERGMRYQSADEAGEAFRAVRRQFEASRDYSTFVWPDTENRQRPRPIQPTVSEAGKTANVFTTLSNRGEAPATARRIIAIAIACGGMVLLLATLAVDRTKRTEALTPIPASETVPATAVETSRGEPPPNAVSTPPRQAQSELARSAVPAPTALRPGPSTPPQLVSSGEKALSKSTGSELSSKLDPVGPSPATPTPETPTLGIKSASAEEESVMAVVEAYAQAHRDRSTGRLRMIQPSLTPTELATIERTFVDFTEYDYRIRQPRVSFSDEGARVLCIVTLRLTSSGPPRVVNQRATFDLERSSEGRWIVKGYKLAPQ